MKKILFAAMAALAITSCSQNEEIDTLAQKAEIKINTAVSKTSRAMSTTTSTFRTFTAYAYSHTGVFANATTLNPLIPETAFTSTDGAIWTAGSKFYWPDTDNVSFFAFSPNTEEQITYTGATAQTAPTLKYKVKTIVKDQEDLIVAELMNKVRNSSAATDAVSLNFKHALTKVGFKIKAESEGVEYTLSKIVIKAKGNGVYTYNASTTNATELGKWDITGATEATYDIAPTAALSLIGKDTDPAVDETLYTNDYTAMLIPQDLTNVEFDIYYKAETSNGVVLRDKTTTPETLTFSHGSWGAGQNLVYTLSLKVEEITVNGVIETTWDSTPEDGDPITTK